MSCQPCYWAPPCPTLLLCLHLLKCNIPFSTYFGNRVCTYRLTIKVYMTGWVTPSTDEAIQANGTRRLQRHIGNRPSCRHRGRSRESRAQFRLGLDLRQLKQEVDIQDGAHRRFRTLLIQVKLWNHFCNCFGTGYQWYSGQFVLYI